MRDGLSNMSSVVNKKLLKSMSTSSLSSSSSFVDLDVFHAAHLRLSDTSDSSDTSDRTSSDISSHVTLSNMDDDYFLQDLEPSLSELSSTPLSSRRQYSSRDSERSSFPKSRKKKSLGNVHYAQNGHHEFHSSPSFSLSLPSLYLSSSNSIPTDFINDYLICTPPPTISFSDLHNMQQVHVGRSSIIYRATYREEPVAVKLMIQGFQKSQSVQTEFKLEQHLLSYLKHPNIVRLIGIGQINASDVDKARNDNVCSPRHFTVMEWLDHSLDELVSPRSFLENVFQSPRSKQSSSNKFRQVLSILVQISSALRYIHNELSTNTLFIEVAHRKVMPEHFRYNRRSPKSEGGIKLISFMSCLVSLKAVQVKSAADSSTSSLTKSHCSDYCDSQNIISAISSKEISFSFDRSMFALPFLPPEIALRLCSASTSSDAYAFAMLSWQLLKRKSPFGGICSSKSDFMSRVVYNGERPKISSSWPADFVSVLEACWRSDPSDRPLMSVVCDKLNDLCEQLDNELVLTKNI